MTLESQNERLYTAKQAAVIAGFESAELQNILDRDYVEATVVPQGNRTYRMFTRAQLVWLWAFNLMTTAGRAKPSIAGAYVKWLNHNLTAVLVFDRPVEFLIFDFSSKVLLPHFVLKGDGIEKLKHALKGGAFVLDYEAAQQQVDHELRNIHHLDRYIELHPEKFSD